MDVNYGKHPPFTVGIEEEFQILDAESYELVQRFDPIAESVGDPVHVKAELQQSTIETATPVSRSVGEAVEHCRALRAALRDAAAQHGALIAAAGTHPFSRWEHQAITEGERYEGIVESLQWVAERVVIFGLHVHVGLQHAQQAIAVANALRTWIPELLALSASSPFWHGRDTGLSSARSVIFQGMPRSGLPPAFASFEEWELAMERMVKVGFVEDYTYIWWDLRPHPRLGTIELRACDAQSRVETVAALAALTQCLAAMLAERHDRGEPLPIHPVTLVSENKWLAARHGLSTDLVDLEHDTIRPAREAVLELVELVEPWAERLGCSSELLEVEHVCSRGTGADEQRAAYEEQGSLLAVARRMVELTAAL
jgi:carboxylate-amine ligase